MPGSSFRASAGLAWLMIRLSNLLLNAATIEPVSAQATYSSCLAIRIKNATPETHHLVAAVGGEGRARKREERI